MMVPASFTESVIGSIISLNTTQSLSPVVSSLAATRARMPLTPAKRARAKPARFFVNLRDRRSRAEYWFLASYFNFFHGNVNVLPWLWLFPGSCSYVLLRSTAVAYEIRRIFTKIVTW